MREILKRIINRPITICSVIIVLIVCGVLSILRMNVNLLPDMNMPILTMQYTYVGANASTVLEDVTKPIEEAISSISDIRKVTTYSLDNGGAVAIFFEFDVNIEKKLEEVKSKVDNLELPDECSEIKISNFDLNGDAIATIALYDNDIDTLSADALKLKNEIISINGVEKVEVIGSYEKKIKICAIEGLDIASLLIAQAMSSEGYNIPLGSMYEDGELIYIRNASDASSIDDLKNIPVSFTFKKTAFERINDFKDLIKKYEAWTMDEFEANIQNELISLVEELNVEEGDVDPAIMQRLAINYKPVLRSVKKKYADEDGNPLKDENGKVITYSASDFKYIYDALELKSFLKLNLSEDLINLLIDVDFNNVRSNGDDTATLILKLSKIASVEEVNVYDSYSEYNNSPSITLEVYTSQNANTTKIVSEVKNKMKGDYSSKTLLLDDRASFISDSINNILVSIIVGAILAVSIIYVFIRKIRTALIIAITLPLSVITTLFFLYLLGISMNMVSLGGLAVGIGMLVDNSIVVLESILKQRDSGYSAFDASVKGTMEVSGSLFASTITNVLVFLPILFIRGMTKMIFNDLVYSIGFSMVMSLLVALTVIPCLYALLYKKNKTEEIKEIEKNPPLNKYETRYNNILKKVLRRKGLVCIIALVVFALSTVLVFTSKIEFLPSIDKGIVEVTLTYDNSRKIDEIKDSTDLVCDKISSIDNVSYIASSIGGKNLMNSSRNSKIRIQLDTKKVKTKDVINTIRQKCNEVEGIKNVSVVEIDGVVAEVTSTFASLSMSIEGEDISTLREIATKIEDKIVSYDGIVKASDDLSEDNNQIDLIIDKNKCAEYGIEYMNVVLLLRLGISSYKVATLHEGSDTVDVVIEFNQNTLTSMDKIESTILGFHNNQVITLSDVSSKRSESVVSSIKRSDGLYEVQIDVESYGITNGEASKIMREVAKEVLLDYPDYRYVETGISNYLSEAFSGLVTVLIISFLLLYLVLACQFASLIKPLIVIMAIPFSFTGGFLALVLTGTSLNVVSFVGIIMLMGVIVNAAIVMIDKIDLLIKDGMSIEEAVTYGPASRLRAISMSTLTTILALIPLSLGIGKGSELMQPMGISVFGGLLLGTLVTLIIIPCFYCIVKRVKIK